MSDKTDQIEHLLGFNAEKAKQEQSMDIKMALANKASSMSSAAIVAHVGHALCRSYGLSSKEAMQWLMRALGG